MELCQIVFARVADHKHDYRALVQIARDSQRGRAISARRTAAKYSFDAAQLARGFTPTPGAFSFGVCASGGTAPVCSADPNTVPKAVDVLTPAGVSQATELDPTLGPVVIQPVPVP